MGQRPSKHKHKYHIVMDYINKAKEEKSHQLTKTMHLTKCNTIHDKHSRK